MTGYMLFGSLVVFFALVIALVVKCVKEENHD